MDKFIGLTLLVLCLICSGCSGSIRMEPEEEHIGTVTEYGDEPAQPTDGEGGAGGEVGEGGAGDEGGVAQNQPSDDCSADALVVKLSSTTPQSQIVTAWEGNTGMWSVFSRYVVSNDTDQDRLVTSVKIAQVDPNGDVADFHSVVIAMDGLVYLQSYGQGSVDGKSFVLEQGGGFVIPALTSKIVEVRAQLTPVVSGSAAGGQWHGVSRSGHTPSLALTGYRLECDASDVIRPVVTANPNPMVLRKSKPMVTQLPLPTNKLANGDMELFKFQIGADPAGAIGLRVVAFAFTKSQGVTIKAPLSVRKDGLETDIKAYPEPDGILYVEFWTEQSIASSIVYTIHGVVSGAAKGESVTIGFVSDQQNTKPVTGKVTSYSMPFLHLACDGINEGSQCPHPYYPLPGYPTYLLWSDLSEVPHESYDSRDWTTDLWVDLYGSETLSL